MFNPDPRETYAFRGISCGGDVQKNTSTNIDFKVASCRWLFSGAEAIYSDAVFGDSVSVSIIDIDNVLGMGENVVLDTFLTNWYLNPDHQSSKVELNYAGKLPKNVYIRFTYKSIGTVVNPKFLINLFIHERLD